MLFRSFFSHSRLPRRNDHINRVITLPHQALHRCRGSRPRRMSLSVAIAPHLMISSTNPPHLETRYPAATTGGLEAPGGTSSGTQGTSIPEWRGRYTPTGIWCYGTDSVIATSDDVGAGCCYRFLYRSYTPLQNPTFFHCPLWPRNNPGVSNLLANQLDSR